MGKVDQCGWLMYSPSFEGNEQNRSKSIFRCFLRQREHEMVFTACMISLLWRFHFIVYPSIILYNHLRGVLL